MAAGNTAARCSSSRFGPRGTSPTAGSQVSSTKRSSTTRRRSCSRCDIRFFSRQGDYKDGGPFHLEHCNQTIFVGKDGRGAQVPPGTTIEYTVRDLYDRPWARIWEQYFEKDMKRPAEADELGGFR